MSSEKTFLGHPRGLATLFFTEMWERFSYYGMRAILILFMTTETAQQGLGLDVETSAAVYGLYTAAVYLLSLPGGWLADNIFGQQKSIWYGGILIMIGHLVLAIPGHQEIFFTGLAFVAIGTGFLKPNISSIVGDLYGDDKGARRDAGFSIFYMGINIGSLLGQTVVSFLGEKVDWHMGFGAAAVGMFLGLVQYKLTQGTLKGIGEKPQKRVKLPGERTSNTFTYLLTVGAIALIFALQYFGVVDVTTATGIAKSVGVLIVVITLAYFANIFIAGGLDVKERKQVFVIFLLFIGAAIFWAGFEQAGSTLNLFSRDYTDRFIFGYELPAGLLQNFNPFFIIVLSPVFGALWIRLSAKGLNPNTPVKFGLGLISMAFGFLIMYFAALIAAQGAKAGMGWLIFTYLFHTAGELTLSPVGLSATTKLAPRKYYSQMMGIWFVATALGNLIAGLFAGGFDPENASEVPNLFMSVVMLGTGAGIMFLIFSGFMRKWMGDVK
ncbi:peptide MFS transporter [Marinoscillum furvescens]|uniref:POT family proton-dependent oligopeptide transporter n=1 Tax=Marinoscillum furvescens DSM 4134 TaxID=1122208 RepID=A0A3D9L756_MARFU|nr:oligopeptide:H+ symporter [Marinoscillum furvescens]REE02145.1 POT family proton-dependent oligopeptide transporter [Marinoscillum furvescens DSM 4134]